MTGGAVVVQQDQGVVAGVALDLVGRAQRAHVLAAAAEQNLIVAIAAADGDVGVDTPSKLICRCRQRR
jgi:hypothetical protein